VRTTKCCSSSCSAGVKQLMSVPTARRTIRPDVGEPSGTFAVTITLVPRCSIWSMSCARPPAPHASMAASSALLGSAPTSVSFLCRCSCCQCGGCCNDGHFVGTPPPSKLTLKVMRSMGACVGSNGTNGAPSTGQRSRRTRPPMIRGFRAKIQNFATTSSQKSHRGCAGTALSVASFTCTQICHLGKTHNHRSRGDTLRGGRRLHSTSSNLPNHFSSSTIVLLIRRPLLGRLLLGRKLLGNDRKLIARPRSRLHAGWRVVFHLDE
jgi:hypothetical protein